MNILLEIIPDERNQYVAHLTGLCKKDRYRRKFLEGQDLGGHLIFRTPPGLYEIQLSLEEKHYIGVTTSGKNVDVEQKDLELVRERCIKCDVDFIKVIDEWLSSSDSLVHVVQHRTDEQYAAYMARKDERSRQVREKVATITPRQAFELRDSHVTGGFIRRLRRHCEVAAALFRALKCSDVASRYYGKYAEARYEAKDKTLLHLCETLQQSHFPWGWREDNNDDFEPWSLYVELPGGLVVLQSSDRTDGPDYDGQLENEDATGDRILDYCDAMLLQPLREEALGK